MARLAVVAALVLVWTAPCLATTVVAMSEADLASEAAAVVLGRVTNLWSHLDAARGQIFTDVTLAVDEVVAGPALPATVTLRQPGGQVGHVRTWIDGSPEFSIGERVLVYLKVARDGTLRVLQLYQGKLSVMTDPLSGDEVAIRITGGGVRVLVPSRRGATSPPKDTHRLDDLRLAIRAARARSSQLSAPPMQTAPAVGADVVQQQDAFVFLGTPSRWFEPDSGAAITVAINSSGQPQAPTLGFDQIRQGFAAWSNDPQANFRYADGGFTSAGGLRFDGVNAVSFNDPDGAMDAPVNCSGTLAMGGFSRSTTESRVVNGTTFMRILDGDVVFNDGWQGCGFYETFGNFAEVATHELGHVLGLGHSTDPTATMFASAHFDGRGASLKADDLAGLRFVYPATTSQVAGPTLAFSVPANGATVSGTTTVSLAVTGTAPYTYQVSLDGTSISTSASFAWNTPAVTDGAHTLSATVRDASGQAASASITVTVANGGGGGAGALRVAITQPTSGATVSGVPWAVMWLEGSNAASSTFTLTLGGQPMGTTTTSSRGPVSMPYDTRVVANGPQPLTATVRDAAGNSGTTTVSVIVSNAGGGAPSPPSPPSPPAPPSPPPPTGTLSVFITSPSSGTTVSGTSWVTLWLNGASGTSNTYTLTVGSQTVATTTTSSTGPVSIPWSTGAVADGTQTLTASARDASGNTGAASITITVANGGAPPPPPPPAPGGALKVFVTSPANGATVSGTVWVNIWVEGASAGAKIFTLRAGGAAVGTATDSGVHVTMPWNTPGTPNGSTTLSATVQDASGASGSTSLPVTVGN